MAKHKNITIKDVDGNVLYDTKSYARKFDTRKAFIQQLVTDKKSLARADLSGANLSHLKLDLACFDGADLSGANLTGTSCRHASFVGADMRGIVAPGLWADRANFKSANLGRLLSERKQPEKPVLTRSILAGAILSFGNFDGAILDHADFSDAGLSSSTMIGVSARKADFRKARLHNVDWSHSSVTSCIFDEAEMTPTLKVSEQHLPDRTREATIIGNSLKNAQVGVGNAGFKRDAVVGTCASWAIWGGVTLGFIVGGAHIPVDADLDIFQKVLGQGMGLLAVTTAASMVKERISDTIKDKLTEFGDWSNLKVRSFLKGLARRGTAIGSLAVAFVSSGHSHALVGAIKQSSGKKGIANLGTVLGGKVEVIVCNRKRLARALTRLSETLSNRGTPRSNVVLVRQGMDDLAAPRAIVHGTDGSVVAVWRDAAGTRTHLAWDAEGAVSGNHATNGPDGADMRSCFRSFAKSLLAEHGAADMNYDDTSHDVRTGRDGSVVIVRKDGRIDNRLGPAVLTPDDRRLHFRGGSHVGHERETHVTVTRAGMAGP